MQGQVESKVMAELAERQEIILQQLEDLRLQMLKLKDQILADCNNKEDIKESRQSKPAVLQVRQTFRSIFHIIRPPHKCNL